MPWLRTGLDGLSSFCQNVEIGKMNDKMRIRLEAWFDGEVPSKECSEIEGILREDAEARDYIEELDRLRGTLQGAHISRLDEERAWENVRGAITQRTKHQSSKVLSFPQMMAAAAAIVLVGMGVWLPLRQSGFQAEGHALESSVYMVETELEGATPIVYLDEPSGWTVVWVVEPEGTNPG